MDRWVARAVALSELMSSSLKMELTAVEPTSKLREPPTLRFCSTPTPPSTMRAPVSLSVEAVLSKTVVAPRRVVAPVTLAEPPTLRFLAMPMPPLVTMAPNCSLVDSVVVVTSSPVPPSQVKSPSLVMVLVPL